MEGKSTGARWPKAQPMPTESSAGMLRATYKTVSEIDSADRCAERQRYPGARSQTCAGAIRGQSMGGGSFSSGCNGLLSSWIPGRLRRSRFAISSPSALSIVRKKKSTSKDICANAIRASLRPWQFTGWLIVEGPGDLGLEISCDADSGWKLLSQIHGKRIADRNVQRSSRKPGPQRAVWSSFISDGGLSYSSLRGDAAWAGTNDAR